MVRALGEGQVTDAVFTKFLEQASRRAEPFTTFLYGRVRDS